MQLYQDFDKKIIKYTINFNKKCIGINQIRN